MNTHAETIVIKISGHEIDDPAALDELAAVVRGLAQPVVVVHGGGKEITALQQQLGIEPRYIEGLRVTDAASLAVAEMVLCGIINKRIVRHLVRSGVEALGLSGVDRGIVRAHKLHHPDADMGFTGKVAQVRGDVLQALLAAGITPVMAPICLGDAHNYNVNADHVAGAVGAAVGADRIVFITNVPGVMKDGTVLSALSIAQAEALMRDGTIFGGMLPKVRTALAALQSGVRHTMITNLEGLRTHSGTLFSAAPAS